MTNKVLVIMSSVISEDKSYSTELWKRFIKHYKIMHHEDEVILLDLNNEAMAQKTLTRQNFNNYFNEQDTKKYIDQLKSVNKIVVSSQMMNFNIPGILKNYIDHVLAPNQTFSYKYDKKGEAFGLLGIAQKDIDQATKTIPNIFERKKFLEQKRKPIKVQILATQGAPLGWYPWGDHVGYLKGTFDFIGCQVMTPLLIDGTKIPENNSKTPQQRIDEYDTKIKELVQKF